jgi:hypothetical protein
MAFQRLQFRPGVVRDQTNYTGEGGWWDGDKVRFYSGYPQKLGGWKKYTANTLIGTCRQMWGWITTFSDNFLGLGTNAKVYIEAGGNLSDITPYADISAAGDITFSATAGSATITVTDPAISATVGNYVTFSGALGLGGNITAAVLNQNYRIATVISGTQSTIEAKSPTTGLPVLATSVDASTNIFTANVSDVITFTTYTPVLDDVLYVSTTSALPNPLVINTKYYVITPAGSTCELSLTIGGAAINITTTGTGIQSAQGASTVGSYEIDVGNIGGTYGYGWGVGGWSRGGWGSGAVVPVKLPQRDWWFDNFYNNLVMNIRNEGIYWWDRGEDPDAALALAERAISLQALATANGFDPDLVPFQAMQILISQNDKHLIAFGATEYGETTADKFNPLLIRWANQNDPSNWQITDIYSAGQTVVSRGSRIIRAVATRQEILVFTDTHLYTLQFTGTTDVFSLQEYADNISILSGRGVATVNNITYWMGRDKFYAYSGRVDTLPTTLRNYVFNNLNFDQAEQIISGTNEGFNEIWWMYPSLNSQTNDKYVIYNHLEKIWYYGDIERTAWLDSPLRDHPQAVHTDFDTQIGTLLNHEDGIDDDELPMESYIQSNDFDINEGDKFTLIKRIIPDVSFDNSTAVAPEVTFTMRSRNFPGSSFASNVDDSASVISATVDTFTEQIFIRARARQLALKVGSDGLGTQWALGTPRLDGRTDGER